MAAESAHDKAVQNSEPTDLVWMLTGEERRNLRIELIWGITSRGNAKGPPPPGNPLVVDVMIPAKFLGNGVFVTCEFEERDGVRRLASACFRPDSTSGLLKGDLSNFPLSQVEDELDRALRAKRTEYNEEELADVMGEIANLPGPKHAPTRKNSNWPKLLHVAVLYSELCAHPETKTRAHEFFVDRNARNRIDYTWSSELSASTKNVSAQLVKRAREAGFLQPTAIRSRGGELTGLAKYLQRKGFVDGGYADTYDPKRWGIAIDEYYGDPMPPERQDEIEGWFLKFMPADHARDAAKAVADRRIEEWLKEHKENGKEQD